MVNDRAYIPGVETWDALRARRNVRTYSEQPIEAADLDQILEAGRRSPSASNRQRWDFVVVTDRDQLAELGTVWQGAGHIPGSQATIVLVVADDVDDRRPALARVVEVGEPVAEAGAEVQQRRTGLVGHAGVAVGGTGGDALEQAQDRAHLGDVVDGGDEVHLRRSRVREARRHAGVDQRAEEGLRAVGHQDLRATSDAS